MAYYSESFFRDYRNNESEYILKAQINEARGSRDWTTFDIFLSYNIKDKNVIEGIYLFLTKMGKKVYLDFIVDPQLSRENASLSTAQLIRRRLKNSRQLIYAMSCNSTESKWMPWELGVADGEGLECNILPVSSTYYKDFNKKEYLQLYPLLERYQDYYSTDSYMGFKNSYGNIVRFR